MTYDSRDASRRTWNVGSLEKTPSVEQINAGSLQRIADACELMAKNHAALIEERDRFERWYREERARVNKRDKQIAVYKGIIKRLKAQAGGAR